MAATNATPTFADAGTLFNDATRFLEGGLWQNAVSEGGQGLGSAARVPTDLKTVQAVLQTGIANLADIGAFNAANLMIGDVNGSHVGLI